jgi:predicted CXXCH cytochrome family protein
MSWYRAALFLIGGAVFMAVLVLTAPPDGPHSTQAAAQPVLQNTPDPNLSIGNETCLSCHGNPGISMTLNDGEEWSLFVPEGLFARSVHGEQGYACVQCHTQVGEYPHPPFEAENARDASLQLVSVCQRCHTAQFEQVKDSVHETALQAGNLNAAICTDCHTAHTTRRLTQPDSNELLPQARDWVPQTCANCHYAIYQIYAESVHGSALLEGSDPNVPTCTDCHGVHSIEDPNTAAFRLRSPNICAGCHTNPEIMEPYGISTQVLDTYVADFHGTTVVLFQRSHPDQETNKPVCYDCHGIHNIIDPDDPEKGLRVKQNLLETCQRCHPDASQNFPTAWLSHYIPSPDRYPLVFTVDTFYRFFIPVVLGGMTILVIMDAMTLLRKWRAQRIEPAAPEGESPASEESTSTAPDSEQPSPEEDTGSPSQESENG